MLDCKLVGENIARLRKASGLTQQELADKLFVTCQAVSGWERGQYLPSVDNLVDLSKLLNCAITDILEKEKVPEFVEEIIDTSNSFSGAEVIAVAPFISKEQADEMANKITDFDAYMLCGLAPFVSADTLYSLLSRCAELPPAALCGLAPFLTREQFDKIMKKA